MFCQKCGNKLPDGSAFCDKCGAQTNPVPVAPLDGKKQRSAGIRLADYAVDLVCYYAITALVNIFLLPNPFLNIKTPADISAHWVAFLLYYAWIFLSLPLFYIFFEGIWARTPGKWATRSKVVRLDGSKPRFWRVVGRSFARMIPFEAFSFLTGTAIGWHDSLTDTLVVPSSYTAEDVQSIRPSGEKSYVWIIIVAVVAGLFMIAIIGILSSVVLASLNTARNKGADAAIQSRVIYLRPQAEIYFDENKGYTGFCDTDTAKQALEATLVYSSRAGESYVCNDGSDAWAATAPLRSAGYWCVDSTGASEMRSIPLMNERECGPLPLSLGTTSVAPPLAGEFKLYASPSGDFQVMFPGTPILSSSNSPIAAGISMSATTYRSTDGVNAFNIVKIQYSSPLPTDDKDGILESLMTSTVSKSNGVVVSSEYGYAGTVRILDLVMNAGGLVSRLRFMYVDNRTFYILIAGDDKAAFDSFVASFKLL